MVTAVYWRINDHVAVGDPALPAACEPTRASAAHAAPARAGLRRRWSRPAPLRSPPAERTFDPIAADEVAAFKQALAAGVRGEQALARRGAAVRSRTELHAAHAASKTPKWPTPRWRSR